MSAKENQEPQGEEPSELQSVASPRISSVGAPSEEAGRGEQPYLQGDQPAYELTAGHDHLHWGGVGGRLPHDARSVASSAAATYDRDEKSIYADEALDATEEGEEHIAREHDEEEEPEEIALTQANEDGLPGIPRPLRSEPSAVESAFTAISAGGSLADVVDQLADQAVAGELSPRQAAAAIRSATARGASAAAAAGEGADAAGAGVGSPTGEAGGPMPNGLDGGSDSVSFMGAGRSSMAPSDEGGWQGGGLGLGGSSTADLMETVPLEEAPLGAAAGAPDEVPVLDAAQAAPAAAEAQPVAAEALEAPAAGVPAEAEQAEQQQQEDVQDAEAAAASESAAGRAEPAAMLTAAVEDGGATAAAVPVEAAAAGSSGVVQQQEQQAQQPAEEPAGSPVAAAAVSAAGAVAAAGPPSAYQSRLMQQLTASASEDDMDVYTADAAGMPQEAVPSPLAQPPLQQQEAGPAAAAAAQPMGSSGSTGMQSLSIANGNGKPGVMPTADTNRAMAAINAVGSSSGGGDAATQQAQLLFPPQWYETFKGLLYMDGVDSLGRPVVVLNADAVPPNMKASALVYVKAHLEPLVSQGDYVLVFTSRGAAKLPSMWIMGAYRSLPRPFRKHVQYIVLVRPSAFLRAVLAFMRPFVSKKAGRKIKQVDSVHDIAAATEGEVTLASLGPSFATEQMAAREGNHSP